MPSEFPLNESSTADNTAGSGTANVPMALTPRLRFLPPKVGTAWAVDTIVCQRERLVAQAGTMAFNVYIGGQLVVANVAMAGEEQSADGTIQFWRGAISLPASLTVYAGQVVEVEVILTPGGTGAVNSHHMKADLRGKVSSTYGADAQPLAP